MESSLPADKAQAKVGAVTKSSGSYGAFAIRIGLGLAIVGFLLWHFDARPALRSLARERPLFFAAAVAIYVSGQLLCAWRWQLLASMLNLRGQFSDYLRYCFIGVFTNLFVPGLLGGDAARAFYLGR